MREGSFGSEQDGVTEAKVVAEYLLSGDRPSDTTWWAACWNGHQFETVEVEVVVNDPWFYFQPKRRPGDDNNRVSHEYAMMVYHPVDPRIVSADVDGADRAYPNAAKDGWLFAHADENWHHDHELEAEAALTAVFASEVEARTSKVLSALVTGSSRASRTATTVRDNLIVFREDVRNHVIAAARTRHLGYQHQNPEDSHISDVLSKSLASVTDSWTRKKATSYALIRTSVAAVRTRLATKHSYETRWDKAARLAREAAAKKAEAGSEEGA